jgi:hypothetical protein
MKPVSLTVVAEIPGCIPFSFLSGILQCEPEFAIHIEDNGQVAETVGFCKQPEVDAALQLPSD